MLPQASPAETSSPLAFSVRDAVVEYDRRPVLRGVSLDVRQGEVVAVLGANGSGKSTLLRAMLGLVPLAGGEVSVRGVPLRRFRDWGRIGYVPQRLSAGGGVPSTVREVVTSGRINRLRRFLPPSAADRAAVDDALASVGLGDRAGDSVHELSGGQQQRVLIARALAGGPDVFVMDEPMAGVDAANQQALARTIEGLSNRGATVVLVLHELGPLEPLIRRSVTLDHGVIAHDGAPPRPEGDCARPGHDHVHPHADADRTPAAVPVIEVSRRD
ncbi:metal ABC transporter ATP-binding protein [Actinorugispora endophytica]|uniref:Zinc transport system ATP-binding protein n=1 Tax=Actinorugispora endophytica TaxID=1605990 RepID=A0A4R6V700_9ACTN|nr:metal ABC transporter ATP-binding protein [Actinorugispora endophytica]TDQ52041.1 zinc transport system ATP-binding protein [Actinorugispora endophytica]